MVKNTIAICGNNKESKQIFNTDLKERRKHSGIDFQHKTGLLQLSNNKT